MDMKSPPLHGKTLDYLFVTIGAAPLLLLEKG
jgi:hypothetical protein